MPEVCFCVWCSCVFLRLEKVHEDSVTGKRKHLHHLVKNLSALRVDGVDPNIRHQPELI